MVGLGDGVDEEQVARALTRFEELTAALSVGDGARLIQLLVERVPEANAWRISCLYSS
jgi:hypothetical protein